MMNETFVSYKHFRFLWVNVIFLLILTIAYFIDSPLGGRNGGTILGYTYGGIATAGILYLMWYGIRKRSHDARYTTLKGCLSAHVWLGVTLTIVVPLHSGFQFGLNVHTLAYALMVLTILSGILGATIYLRFPPKVMSHRGGGTVQNLLEQIQVMTNDIDFLAKNRSDEFLRLLDKVDFIYKPSLWQSIRGKAKRAQVSSKDTAALLARIPDTERDAAFQLVSLAAKKSQLAAQIDQEVRLSLWFRAWLYSHLPLSFALLAALAIHIFSVFYYL